MEESLKLDNDILEGEQGDKDEENCKIVEEEFCVSKKREELFAEKEIKLKGSDTDNIAETDSEPEDTTQIAYNIVAESLGLNVSFTIILINIKTTIFPFFLSLKKNKILH